MDKYPNLYGDLSAGSGARAISRDMAFGREFLIRRADRLMFGTDFLAPGQEVPQLTLFRQLQLAGRSASQDLSRQCPQAVGSELVAIESCRSALA